jgi:hypothetical protein
MVKFKAKASYRLHKLAWKLVKENATESRPLGTQMAIE